MELRERIANEILSHTDADTNDANFAADRILAILREGGHLKEEADAKTI
jgi:hypothetical protein